jgi:hypothetical protein
MPKLSGDEQERDHAAKEHGRADTDSKTDDVLNLEPMRHRLLLSTFNPT